MNRSLLRAAVAVTAVVTVTACGVPTQDAPHHVQPPPGPYPTYGAPAVPEAGAAQESLCFIRDDRLTPVVRRLRAWPTVETQVGHLLAGPDGAERAAGLTSALTGTTAVEGIRLSRGQVTLELAESPADGSRSDQVLAFGQIVCTLTTRSDVTAVAFEQGGKPLGIPRGDGSLSDRPLTAADYAALVAF